MNGPTADYDALEPDVSEDELRAFIVEAVGQNRSLPLALLTAYRITPRVIPPDRTEAS